MKTLITVLMAIAGLALILGILMGGKLVTPMMEHINGRAFLALSVSCTIYALGLHLIKPFGGGGEEG